MSIIDDIRNFFTANKKEKRGLSLSTLFPNANPYNADKALTLTAVWCAIRLLAESVSSLPCSVYSKQANGDKVESTNNKIYNLIKYKPNKYQNKITFFEYIMMCICTNGNSYVQIIRDGSGMPIELIPLNPEAVSVVINEGELFYQIEEGGVLDSYDILHFKTITEDGLVGLSPIDQCKNALNWGLNVEEFGNTFFKMEQSRVQY